MSGIHIPIQIYDLPIDVRHSIHSQAEINKHQITLPYSMVDKLNALADDTSYELSTILLSTFLLLLYRLTGQQTITLGYPSETRKDPGISAAAFQLDIERETSFLDLLKSLNNNLSGKIKDSSPCTLVSNTAGEEESSSLFTLYFGYSHSPSATLPPAEYPGAEYLPDLSLNIFHYQDDINVLVSYNRNVLKLSTIERWVDYFTRILDTISTNPSTPFHKIPVLSEQEINLLLYDFNAAAVDYTVDKTIHAIFQDQAEATPNYTALEFHDESMSYDELNRKSNQVARILKRRGVVPDDIVAVFAWRSFEMVYGILGILKAGGAYLPISPAFPGERIQYLLEDSGTKIALTTGILAEKILDFGDILVLDDEVTKEDDSSIGKVGTPDNLSHVIYTSGSTGTPKAVMQCHKTVVASFSTLAKEYPMRKDDAFLFRTIFTFDPSVAELFFWFFGCGKAVIADDGDEKQPDKIVEHIYKHKVTHLVAVPSLLNVFIDSLDAASFEKLNSLKYVFVLGEAVTQALVKRFYTNFKSGSMENIYGPTETLLATNYHIRPEHINADIIPVGKPISSVRIYILDEHMDLQPVGVPGEIYISGENVARGYLHQEEMTRKSFLDDPFQPGKHMYKTGDMGRWLEDGNIDFLGRIDFQVKVSGVRIELGEIENQLLSLDAIREAVVLAKKDKKTGDKFLCAYVVMKEQDISIPDIKASLKDKIPSYMIPAYFVKLEKIPLTQNGKVDRAVLPYPTLDDLHVDYQPPQNELQQKLVNAWQQALDVENVGITHNFFDVGGDSLKAIRLVTKLKNDFRISINDIFEFPTIEELSSKISLKSGTITERIDSLTKAAEISMQSLDDTLKENGALKESYEIYMKKVNDCIDLDLSARIDYQNILLTGGTGFLGSYLLRDILNMKDSHVYLVVRGKDEREASNRLIKKIGYYFGIGFFEQVKDRISIIAGNVTEPCLGMPREVFDEVASKVDCIVNSAANVKHYGYHSQFYDINVELVKRLIEFAFTGRKKALHQLSTIGVSVGSVKDQPILLYTEDDYDVGQVVENHYVNTKMEAEKLILNARQKGLIANIYRIGDIVFDSTSGLFQENIKDNAFYSLIQSYVKLQSIPATEENHDFSFVDYVSKAFTLLFDRSILRNETYHIFNSHRPNLANFISDDRFDLHVNKMALGEFLQYIYNKTDEDSLSHHIQDILLHYGLLDDEITTQTFILSSKTEKILDKLGFNWIDVTEEHIAKMISHCRKANFF